MTHDVFICYSTQDKAIADAVCATLEAHKTRCWIAPRDVPAGVSWAGALTDAIRESAVFVLVFSDRANRSAQVLREVTEAVDQGIPIIPFRIEAVEPTRDLGYYLKPIHWLDALTPPLEQHLEELAGRVDALLVADTKDQTSSTIGLQVTTQPIESGASTAAKVDLRHNWLPWMLVAIMGLVLALIFGVILLTRGDWWALAEKKTAVELVTQAPASEPTPTAHQPALPATVFASLTPVITPGTTAVPQVETSTTPSTVATPPPAGEEIAYVPDKQVTRFFAPGPKPAALAVVTDTIWVADDQQRMLYQLDQSGVPTASYPITSTEQIRGLAWDGQSFYLLQNAYPGHEIRRLDRTGRPLGEAPIRVPKLSCTLTGLTWDAEHQVLWTACGQSALGFDLRGRLKYALQTGALAWIDSLAWVANGICVVGPHRDWNCIDITGRRLISTRLPGDGGESMAWDDRGYVWILRTTEKDITQFSVSQEPLAQATVGGALDESSLPFPRPDIQPGQNAGAAVVRVINRLPGTVSLAFGDRSVVLKPGETWSETLSGEYDVYATTNQPVPLRFSGKEILVAGYEFTWELRSPE